MNELLLLIILVEFIVCLILAIKYAGLKARLESRAKELAKEMLEEWKERESKRLKEDLSRGLYAVLKGRVGEQLAPLVLFEKYGIDLRDLRFLGGPVDYIAFKGLSEGNPEKIIFIEVKSGRRAALSERERAIKRLIEEKRVEWLTLRLSA